MVKKNLKGTKKSKAIKKAKTEVTKVAIDHSELTSTLKIALDFIEKKNYLPALTHIRLTSDGAVCVIRATDLNVSWKKEIPCKGGAVDRLIPAELFYKEIKALSDDVSLAELVFNKASVSVNGRCEIFTLSVADYPETPEADGADISTSCLCICVSNVIAAASKDEYRHNINGVFFDLKKGRLVATDGHRLHIEDAKEADASFILSRKAAILIVKHQVPDGIVAGDKAVFFKLGGGVMMARTLDVDYIDYEAVMPKKLPIKVIFNAAEMLKILEGAVPMIDGGGIRGVCLTINGKLEVKSQSEGLGNYLWHIPCEAEGKKEGEIAIGVNAGYIIDAVKSFANWQGAEPCPVVMELKDPESPFLINKKALIMPMRLNV